MSLTSQTLATLSAERAREWLNDGQEVALLDLREAGQFGEGHPFFAIPLPYSRLELDARRLLPRLDVRVLLLDSGDGVAERGARRLQALGYTQVHVLQGGAPAWAAAGYTLFQGVNLPSKTFGELVEARYHTPHISATELHRRQQAGEPLVLLDGRTLAEHRKMTLPGAVSLPNGELAARWATQVPDATTPVVVHCAGRTRSIIGAEILRHLGLPNPVLALENGTQGWALAGLTLEHGSQRQVQGPVSADPAAQAAARRDADAAGAPHLSVAQYRAGTLDGARHAPGGQLLQATDQSVAVRRSRVLLLDHEDVRAPVIAAWLRRMGYEGATVEGGIHAALSLRQPVDWTPPAGRRVTAHALPGWTAQHLPALIDVQASMAYRLQHATGARWAVRPTLTQAAPPEQGLAVLVLAPSAELAQLAAADLTEAGWTQVHWALQAFFFNDTATTEASPDSPSDAEAIDYLFFVHDRHDGNLEAARRYLAWETGLIAQCQADELAAFQLD